MTVCSQNIVLDTTLHDLYSLDENPDKDVVLVYASPAVEEQLTPSIPLSTRFVYQSPQLVPRNHDAFARRSLIAVPQLYGFIAGKMPLILFDINEAEGEVVPRASSSPSMLSHRADTFRTLEHLSPCQKPELSFMHDPHDIFLPTGAKVAILNPMDCLLHLSHTVDPDTHYQLHSKAALALSALPTPESQVIETRLQPDQIHDGGDLGAEVARMIGPVLERIIPFVVKMPQACAGQGIFLVRTEFDQRDMSGVLAMELKRLLPMLNETNKHLRPIRFVIQKMVPGEAVALSLFITKGGRAIFTSCCKQIIDESGHWTGAFISYRRQDQLRHQYAGIIDRLARYMYEQNYYGPLGADVMTNQDGQQLIIDLNVRVSASHPLGFLKGHFSTRRKLNEAVLFFPLYLSCRRDEFEQAFKREFNNGSLVIASWCHHRDGVTSVTGLALAAEDSKQLSEFIDRVNVYKISD